MSTPVRAIAAIAALVAVVGIGCGSTSTTSVQPTPVKCSVQLSPASASFGAAGGTGTISVKAPPECLWSPVAEASWISQLTPTSAQGDGQVQFRASANSGPDRSGTFSIGDQKVTVNQAAGCAFTVQPTVLPVGPEGGTISVNVSTAPGCTWSAASQTAWVALTSAANNSGSGSAGFSVGANVAVERIGTLLVAGRGVTVTQASGCTFTINPQGQSFDIFGGNGIITVTPSAFGCPWTATSSMPWITIRSGNSGTDKGEVAFTVTPFIGGRRTGAIIIANRTFTVTQN